MGRKLMKLLELYHGVMAYDGEPAVSIQPDGAGVLFGVGSGTVDWGGVEGTISWSNFPRHRPDDVFEPMVTGAIRLDGEDQPILYELTGVSHAPDDDGNRLILASVRWHTVAERFAHLNTSLGVERGILDGTTFAITSTTYLVVAD
jgi:hypothetical protein